jgi:hypothetical protein
MLSESSGASTTGYDVVSSKVHHRASSSLSSVVTPDQDAKEEPHVAHAMKSPITELPLEDIRSFVRRALDGETEEGWPLRNFKVNPPPTDRPVRIYADGTFSYPASSQSRTSVDRPSHVSPGVYDLFHFGYVAFLSGTFSREHSIELISCILQTRPSDAPGQALVPFGPPHHWGLLR